MSHGHSYGGIALRKGGVNWKFLRSCTGTDRQTRRVALVTGCCKYFQLPVPAAPCWLPIAEAACSCPKGVQPSRFQESASEGTCNNVHPGTKLFSPQVEDINTHSGAEDSFLPMESLHHTLSNTTKRIVADAAGAHPPASWAKNPPHNTQGVQKQMNVLPCSLMADTEYST